MLSEERAEAGGSIRCDEYKCAGWKRMGEMGGPGRREESVLCKFGAMAGDRGVGTDPLPKLHPTRLPEIPAFRFWPAGLFVNFLLLVFPPTRTCECSPLQGTHQRLRTSACVASLSFVCSVLLGELLPVGD